MSIGLIGGGLGWGFRLLGEGRVGEMIIGWDLEVWGYGVQIFARVLLPGIRMGKGLA